MATNNITVGKFPASTIHINQPCDVGEQFIASKQKLQLIDDAHVNRVYPDLIKRIKTAIKDNVHSANHLKSASHGVVRILCAINRTWDKSMIMDSFEKTGVYPIDYDRILKHCTRYEMVADEILEIVQKMSRFVTIMRQSGEIPDKSYSKICPKLPDPLKWKDDRNVQNRRSVILTNKQFCETTSVAGIVHRGILAGIHPFASATHLLTQL